MRVDRKVIRAAAVLLTVLTLLLAGALLRFLWGEGSFPGGAQAWTSEPPETDEGELLYYNDTWYAPRKDVETVLVLGLDRSEQEGVWTTGEYAQSDFVLLLEIDRTAERWKVLHINRDTMVEIQDFDQYGKPSGTYTAQLALAYAHAQAYTRNDTTAAHTAMDAVSGLLYGVEIDHYMTVTMDGVMLLNDLAGGVEVEIKDDFSAVDPTLVQGERVLLLGEHALNYVRSRWYVSDNSNLARMARQREYLEALQKKLSGLTEGDEGFAMSALLELSQHMTSDCTVERLAELAETLRTFEMEEYAALEGEAVINEQNYVEFRVDEATLQRLVIEDFYAPAENPE